MSRRSLLICLLAVSCSEQKFSSIDGSADGDGPELRVTPSLIDFGGLSQDDEPVTEQFDIISVVALQWTSSPWRFNRTWRASRS